jgi:mono/diheme cytochrome c family protein
VLFSLAVNPSLAQDPLAGSQIFGTRGCSACHAVGGIGGQIGPDLKSPPKPRSFYDLAAAMWNHLPEMAAEIRKLRVPRPRLDAREANDLVAFLATLDYFDPPGNAKAGGKLFVEKRCAVCHQVGGIGGVVGPNLDRLAQSSAPIAIAAAMWNHGPAMAEAMRARKIERPSFTSAELRDLIAYLKSHARDSAEEAIYALPGRANEGRRLFLQKRCQECHGGKGEGGPLGPALYNRRVPRSLFDFATSMWNKAPSMTRAMKEAGITLPQLSAADMANIVAYLYSVNYFADAGNPARGRALMSVKGCMACHFIGAGAARPGLTEITRSDQPAAFVSALWNHLVVLETPERQTPWPQLTPQEAADLVAFLQSPGG